MRKSKILIICLVCLLVFLIPEENIPNIQIGIIQPHNYELEEEVELTTPQHGSFVQTTKVLSDISNLRKINQIIKLGTFYIHTGVVSNNVKVYRSEDLVTWTDELTIAIANSEIATILGTDGTDSYLVFIKNDGSHYNLCWCKTVNNGDTWTNGSGGAHGTYNEAGIGVTGYDIGDESVILSVFKIGAGWFTLLWEETSGDTFIIDLSDFSTVYTETMDSIGAGCILSTDSNFYFPVVINGETAGKLLKFDGSSVTTHSTIDSDATKFSTDDPSDLFDDLICCERNEILYVFSRVIGVGVVTYYVFQYISSWKELLSNFTSSSSLPLYYTVDVTDRDIRYFIIVDDDGYNLVYSIKENGNIYLIYNEIYDSGTTITQVSLYPYVRKNGSFPYLFEWGPTALSDVSDCKIKKDGLAEFNDYSPTTRFVEKQYVELYNNSNELVYQGFVTKIDRIDLIQKLIHLKSLANYDLEKQLSDSYTTKTYYEMIETSIDTHALYLTYSLDHTPVTTYTMEHKKTLAELIKWGTKQESLKDYVTPATVLTIDVGTTDTGIDVSDADGDVIDEYKSYEITYNPSIVILYGGFVNGVRLVSTWRSTVIGDQPFSDNYPEVVDQTQLDNLAEAIGTGKDFKILVFEFTVFNKAYIQPGQQIDFQYTLDQTNYPVLASKAKYYVISNEINLSQDSQFIRIADALIDEAKGDQKNGLTVENAFQLVEQVQGNVNTHESQGSADGNHISNAEATWVTAKSAAAGLAYVPLDNQDEANYDWIGITATNADYSVLNLYDGTESKTGFDGGGESTTEAINAIPSTAKAVHLRLRLACSSANTANFMRVRRNGNSNAPQALVCFGASVNGYTNGCNGTVELSSDGKVKVDFVIGAGTLTGYIAIMGYYI